MSKRVQVLALVAAVLSVVTVPVVDALAFNNDQASTVISALGVAVGAGAAIFATFAYRRVSEFKQGTDVQEIEAKSSEIPLEIRLLREVAAIENDGRELLGEERYVTIIRIRSDLQRSGIWSNTDVYDFDVALQIRNKVAHGDGQEINRTSVAQAVEALQRLHEKLKPRQTDFGSRADISIVNDESAIQNVSGARFEIYQDGAGKYRFRLKARNGEVVASGGPYESKALVRKACEEIQRATASAAITEVVG